MWVRYKLALGYHWSADRSGSGALRFDSTIDDTALTVLLDNGLRNRFPNECDDWKKRREAARKVNEDNKKSEESQLMERLNDELPQTERILTQAMRHEISGIFPLVFFTFYFSSFELN